MRPASGARLISQASPTLTNFRFPPSDFWFCSFTANSPKLRTSSLFVVCICIHWASSGPTLWDSTCSWAILRRPVETCPSCGFWMGFLWRWHAAWIYRQRKDRGNCPYFARILGFQKMPWKVKWKGKERRK